jgi:glycine cleavage system aminomethyltransferase T
MSKDGEGREKSPYDLLLPNGKRLGDATLADIVAARKHEVAAQKREAREVLRLQKLHILVGQDTDAESNPLEAAMPWIVKFDKSEDFIGRWALEGVQERGAENKLVGFTNPGNHTLAIRAAIVGDFACRTCSSCSVPANF